MPAETWCKKWHTRSFLHGYLQIATQNYLLGMFYVMKLCGQQSGRVQTCQSQHFLLLWRSVDLSVFRVRRKEAPEASPRMAGHSQGFREVSIQGFDALRQVLTSHLFIFLSQCTLRFLKLVLAVFKVLKLFATWLSIVKYCCCHAYIPSTGRFADQHPGLGMHVRKKVQKNGHYLFGHFYYEQHFESVPLFLLLSARIQVVGWQMMCIKGSLGSKDAVAGSFGNSALCAWGCLQSQFGEGASSVL